MINGEGRYRLLSRSAELRLDVADDSAFQIGREFYKACVAAGQTVTVQVVLAGSRYRDCDEADALFRPRG